MCCFKSKLIANETAHFIFLTYFHKRHILKTKECFLEEKHNVQTKSVFKSDGTCGAIIRMRNIVGIFLAIIFFGSYRSDSNYSRRSDLHNTKMIGREF